MPTSPQERDAPQERRRRVLPRSSPMTVCPSCGGGVVVYATRPDDVSVVRYLKCRKCDRTYQEFDRIPESCQA